MFESLASGPKPLDELPRVTDVPQRTARVIVDAVWMQSPRWAQAFLERPRTGGHASVHPVLEPPQLSPLAHAVGLGPVGPRDIRRINFTANEQKICSEGVEGVEAFSAGHASALAEAYDFNRHRRVLDLRGGSGSSPGAIWSVMPGSRARFMNCASTLRPGVGSVCCCQTCGRISPTRSPVLPR